MFDLKDHDNDASTDPIFVQTVLLNNTHGDFGDSFGSGLALDNSGERLVVGSLNESSNYTGVVSKYDAENSITRSGIVFVYQYSTDDNTWSLESTLKASNSSANLRFGSKVAIHDDGKIIAIAAAGEGSNNLLGVNSPLSTRDNLATFSGAVYTFEYDETTSNWEPIAMLKSDDSHANQNFGSDLTFSPNGHLYIGASGDNRSEPHSFAINVSLQNIDKGASVGSVFVFNKNDGQWEIERILKAPNPGIGDRFGFCLSANNSSLLVGAPSEDSNYSGTFIQSNISNYKENSRSESGAAYLY